MIRYAALSLLAVAVPSEAATIDLNFEIFEPLPPNTFPQQFALSFEYEPGVSAATTSDGWKVYPWASRGYYLSTIDGQKSLGQNPNDAFFSIRVPNAVAFWVRGVRYDAAVNIYLDGQPLALTIPEPTTWALFILGFGAIGAGMRRPRVQGSIAVAS